MAAALDHGRVRPGQRVYCEKGIYTAGGRTIHDIGRYGFLTLPQVLEKSSNIGIVKVAETLSAREFHEAITRFGFGSKTGIELPGECAGILNPLNDWSGYTQASLAFGQEIAVTVLQMASAMGTIANEGVLVPPRVVLGIRDADGTFRPSEPPPSRRVLSAEAARQLAAMLEGVIESGTGTRASVAGYRIAGKSGTAQMKGSGKSYSESDFMASFGGFGPVGAPRLAGLVVLNSPRGERHQGGEVAAPVFGRIIGEALRHLRVPSATDPPSTVLLTSGTAARKGNDR
jgi:cell division protein FtsI (penicillin-binding protein 3)